MPGSALQRGLDGGYEVVDTGRLNGPDAFLTTDGRRTAVFFCDPLKPKWHEKTCVPVGPTRF